MTAYTAQPYYAGDLTVLRSVFSRALSQVQRIAIWGDSRTDVQSPYADRLIEQRLNYNAWKRFGPASETPISKMRVVTRAAAYDQTWCCGVNPVAGTVTGTLAGAGTPVPELPPSWSYFTTSNAAGFHVATLLDPFNSSIYSSTAAGTQGVFPWASKNTYFLNDSVAVRPEFFFRKNSASTATKLQWEINSQVSPVANAAGAFESYATLTDVPFNEGSGIMKWVGPTVAHVAGKYDNVSLRGLDDSNAAAEGLQVCGVRWANPGRDQGIVVQSLGAGGLDSAELLGLHPDMAPAVTLFGPYHAHVIILGANDGLSPSYATPLTNYKINMRANIAALQSAPFGGDSTTPVVLLNPYNRTDGSFGTYLDKFTQDLIDLCGEFTNVAFVNIAKIFEELGFDPTNTTQTADHVHLYEQRIASAYHDAIWRSFEKLADSAGAVSEDDITAIVAAIKADADLGTADGGMVAEVNKIPRAATAVTAGAAQQKHLENSLGATLQTVYEVLDGDVA